MARPRPPLADEPDPTSLTALTSVDADADSPRVRRRRRARPVVAVTSADSGVGLSLLRRLAADDRFARPIGLAARRPEGESGAGVAIWRLGEITDPSVATRLGKVSVLVHVAVTTGADGVDTPQRIVRAAATVITAAAAARVPRLVLVTSAMVFGAAADNDVPLADDAPLAAVPDAGLVGALLDVEQLAQRAAAVHPGLSITVVRPAALVGDGLEPVDNVYARHIDAPRLLVVRGSHPRWQFCHVDDLLAALVPAALGEITGSFTVGCDGWLEQEQIESLTGLRRLELPSAVAFGTAERLHRVGILTSPVADLAYVVHPWVVDSARLRETGWRPAYDNETALGLLLEQADRAAAGRSHRLGRRDATLGAAGAAVAVVGTAALVRAARRRRKP